MGYTWTDGELITATKLNNTGGGGGLAHYTDTSGTLNCTYNDLLADITAGRLPYISNSNANITFGVLFGLDTANDYEAWFSGTAGGPTCYFSESADSNLVLAD